ncbi:hypothetical protein D3C81_1808740 [compost metagenome]
MDGQQPGAEHLWRWARVDPLALPALVQSSIPMQHSSSNCASLFELLGVHLRPGLIRSHEHQLFCLLTVVVVLDRAVHPAAEDSQRLGQRAYGLLDVAGQGLVHGMARFALLLRGLDHCPQQA